HVGGIGPGGEKNNGDVPPVLDAFDALAGLEAVQLGHHHVQQDQVGSDLLADVERLLAVGGDPQLLALVFQDGRGRPDIGRCVVDDQDPFIHPSARQMPYAAAARSSTACASAKA